MREILFRGKRIDNGEWVEGYVYSFPPVCRIRRWLPVFKRYGDVDVNPSTVGQYTGLTDKNGKRIFEGDIVEKDGVVMYVVEFRGSWSLWDYDGNEGFLRNWCSSHYLNGEDVGGCVVIGNVYDNYELLKQGDADGV